MTATAAVRALLVADAALALLVPDERIVVDDVLPQGTGLPAILIGLVSGNDLNLLSPGSSVFMTHRVQVEIHASNNPERQAVKKAVRKVLLSNPRPSYAGMAGLTLHTEGEGPDFFNADPYVRVGLQDCKLTWTEQL